LENLPELTLFLDGFTWLSIFQNKPTTDAIYEGTVEITGDIVGTCKYENGQYCGATGCNKDGCTVSSPVPTSRIPGFPLTNTPGIFGLW
jgi:hypothetical protein